jgi:hypothetical protein
MKVKPVMDALDERGAQVILVHTGQHYDPAMSEVFFADLGIRNPDHFLGAGSGTHAVQTCRVMTAFEPAGLPLGMPPASVNRETVSHDRSTRRLPHMPGDIAHRRALRVHADNHRVQANRPAGLLGDQDRIEAALPVPRHRPRK